MVTEDATRLLEYLKKQGQANTFRLARELEIERHKLLNIIKKLVEEEVVEFRHGAVKFLKFPVEEKIKTPVNEVKKISRPRRKIKAKRSHVFESLQIENKKLKEKLLELQTNVKRLADIKNKKLREQSELIKNLGKKIEEIRYKPKPNASIKTHKKIVKKRVIKKSPPTVIKKPRPVKHKKKLKLPKVNFPKLKKIFRSGFKKWAK